MIRALAFLCFFFCVAFSQALDASIIPTGPCDPSGDSSIVLITGLGGTGTYTLRWINPASPEMSFSYYILPVGSDYSFDISDGVSTVTKTFSIVAPEEAMSITFTDIKNATCDEGTGSATISISGGVPPYSYSWIDVSHMEATESTTVSTTGLAPGKHTVSVQDSNTCVFGWDFTIFEPTSCPTYYTIATGEGKVITATPSGSVTYLLEMPYTGAHNQMWSLESNPQFPCGVFIRSRANGLVWDAQAGQFSQGTPVVLFPLKDTTLYDNRNQRWIITDTEIAIYDSSMVVGISEGGEVEIERRVDGSTQQVFYINEIN